MFRPTLARLAILCALGAASAPSAAGPVSGEEAARRAAAAAALERAVAAEPSASGKVAAVRAAMAAEPDADRRRRLLDLAAAVPGPEREALLTDVLAGDGDALVRGHAAKALGRVGSAGCLAALARAAAADPVTEARAGDVGGRSTARRDATFAVAALAARHPAAADDAAAALRKLPAAPAPEDSADNQGLADARAQALYQITRDDALLAPFRDRLKSPVARDREGGVVAFRFLALKAAPPEVTAAAADPDAGVRRWAALVLGEIGDPGSVGPLMALAGDAAQDLGVRSNALHALGVMRAGAAAPLAERLLADPAPGVPAVAAVALYRITGRKAPPFPAGYDAD